MLGKEEEEGRGRREADELRSGEVWVSLEVEDEAWARRGRSEMVVEGSWVEVVLEGWRRRSERWESWWRRGQV